LLFLSVFLGDYLDLSHLIMTGDMYI